MKRLWMKALLKTVFFGGEYGPGPALARKAFRGEEEKKGKIQGGIEAGWTFSVGRRGFFGWRRA